MTSRVVDVVVVAVAVVAVAVVAVAVVAVDELRDFWSSLGVVCRSDEVDRVWSCCLEKGR